MAFLKALTLLLLSAGAVQGAWKPADGVKELDAVEAALHRIVDNPKLSPAQMRMAKRVVGDVDAIVAQLQASKGITKQAKMQKVGQAMQELQDLQGQFELSAVQQSLTKLVNSTHMSAEMAKTAKEIAENVNQVAQSLENGKSLSREEKAKKVQGAIKQLQGLQGLLEHQEALAGNTTANQKLQTLEHELALKKKELAKADDMLKLAKLQKELAEKKEQLRELEEKKAGAKAVSEADEKAAKQQEEMVAKLVAMAGSLKAKKETKKAALPAPIQAILVDLRARAQNVSSSLAKMDAEEKARESKTADAVKSAADGKDAKKAKKLQSMLKFLGKEEKHSYSKLRAAKQRSLDELNEAISGVESGDMASVQKVMTEMQHDVKSIESKSHKFLY